MQVHAAHVHLLVTAGSTTAISEMIMRRRHSCLIDLTASFSVACSGSRCVRFGGAGMLRGLAPKGGVFEEDEVLNLRGRKDEQRCTCLIPDLSSSSPSWWFA